MCVNALGVRVSRNLKRMLLHDITGTAVIRAEVSLLVDDVTSLLGEDLIAARVGTTAHCSATLSAHVT